MQAAADSLRDSLIQMPSYTLAVATVLAVISFIASQLLVCINTHSRLCIQPPQLDGMFATGRWYPTTNRLLLLTISNETGINRDVVITSELATVHSTTPSHQSLSDLQMTRLSSINWWPLGQNLLSIISDIILVMNIILVLLPLITSNPSPNDPNDLNDIGSTTNLLQQLSLGPTHHQKQCSWLRSAEELMLLSSSPNRHNHHQQQSSPIIISTDTSHDLLWPARLQHPRACLTSATASLSLTDQHTLSLN